jgi:hypothetical protein
MARAAPATAGLAIAADAQFPVIFSSSGRSKWSGHAIAVEHWRACGRVQEDGREMTSRLKENPGKATCGMVSVLG